MSQLDSLPQTKALCEIQGMIKKLGRNAERSFVRSVSVSVQHHQETYHKLLSLFTKRYSQKIIMMIWDDTCENTYANLCEKYECAQDVLDIRFFRNYFHALCAMCINSKKPKGVE